MRCQKTENTEDFDTRAGARVLNEDTARQHIEENNDIGIILHITDSEEKLFPEAQSEEACKSMDNCSEVRRVYRNNDWQIKDTIGTTDFDELIANFSEFSES